MFGPVEDLILHFEYDDDRKKQFYFPGETLRGTILVRIRRRLRVRKITMHIFGGAAVSWEIPNKKKIYSAQEEYIQGSNVVYSLSILASAKYYYSYRLD